MRTGPALLLTLALGRAAAGGHEPLTRTAVLRSVPGVQRVQETNFTPAGPGGSSTHRLTVAGLGGTPLEASIGERAGPAGHRLTVGLWVRGRTVTPAQATALANVAAAYLARCFPDVTPEQVRTVRTLAGRLGRGASGWQQRQTGPLTLGWSGSGDAMQVDGSHRAVGLSVEWPGAGSRCTF